MWLSMNLASDFLWNWLPQQIEPKSRLFDTKRTPKCNHLKLTLAAGWCQSACVREGLHKLDKCNVHGRSARKKYLLSRNNIREKLQLDDQHISKATGLVE